MVVLNRSKITVQKEPITNDVYYKIDALAGRVDAFRTKEREIHDLDKEFPDNELTPNQLIHKQKLTSEIRSRIKVIDLEITKLEKELNW